MNDKSSQLIPSGSVFITSIHETAKWDKIFKSIFEDGAKAYLRGISIDNNAYVDADPALAEQWQQGWLWAEEASPFGPK